MFQKEKVWGLFFTGNTIEQLEGGCISGRLKIQGNPRKHWIRYPWLDGEECEIEIIEDEDSRVEIRKLEKLGRFM